MFGFGRPQPSSAEKIAAAEQEMDLVTDMFNKYVSSLSISSYAPAWKEPANSLSMRTNKHLDSHKPASRNVYQKTTAKENSTRAKVSVLTVALPNSSMYK